jgi:NADH:ubiquinone oxidoreductase subunit 6 (subunit J)
VPPPISEDWVFYLAAVYVIVCALGVVVMRNVMHAALLLGACFFGVAGLYIMLHAQFLAVAQVMIYVGDVTVLILFALMLTRGVVRADLEKWGVPVVAGTLIAILSAVMLVTYITRAEQAFIPDFSPTPLQELTKSAGTYGIVAAFSQQMLTDYLLPFEVASGILLMALVGSIVLAKEEPTRDS